MAAAPLAAKPLQHFGPFVVTSQVFFRSTHSFGLVNLKPLLPGHVLVCPARVVPRLKDLTAEEVTDLFLSVQRVSKHIERIYAAHALNIAVQDGVAAGQSVPHVHAHIIPRTDGDLPEDEIYRMMESEDADLGRAYRRTKFPAAPGERKPRSAEEMEAEAAWLEKRMREVD